MKTRARTGDWPGNVLTHVPPSKQSLDSVDPLDSLSDSAVREALRT